MLYFNMIYKNFQLFKKKEVSEQTYLLVNICIIFNIGTYGHYTYIIKLILNKMWLCRIKENTYKILREVELL